MDRDLSYKLFLTEQALEEAKLERYINECILISEGSNTFANIDIIHESFTSKIKSIITKLVQAIANMWNKFLENMNTLLKTDKAYLEKYKDIILKKTPKKAQYNMYMYTEGLPVLLKTEIPVININNMDKELESDEAFLKQHFNHLISGAKEPYKIGEIARARFRGRNGQEIIVNSYNLKMTDMYNYCYTYKKLEELIRKDITNIQKVSNDIINKIDTMAKNGEIKKESFDLLGRREYLSSVYESYVEEATPGSVVDGSKDNSPKQKQTTDSKDIKTQDNSNNNSQQGNPAQNRAYQAYNSTEKGNSEQEINTEKTAKELSDKVSRYLRICGEILGAKQSIAEEIYKAYMSIIKTHVRDYVSKKDDKKDNKVQEKPTDYSKFDIKSMFK